MSDLRTGMLETNVKTGDPAEENASSLHRVRTQNRKKEEPTMKLTEMLGQYEELLDKKDQLAKDTKDNNAAIDKLKAEIAE